MNHSSIFINDETYLLSTINTGDTSGTLVMFNEEGQTSQTLSKNDKVAVHDFVTLVRLLDNMYVQRNRIAQTEELYDITLLFMLYNATFLFRNNIP